MQRLSECGSQETELRKEGIDSRKGKYDERTEYKRDAHSPPARSCGKGSQGFRGLQARQARGAEGGGDGSRRAKRARAGRLV